MVGHTRCSCKNLTIEMGGVKVHEGNEGADCGNIILCINNTFKTFRHSAQCLAPWHIYMRSLANFLNGCKGSNLLAPHHACWA